MEFKLFDVKTVFCYEDSDEIKKTVTQPEESNDVTRGVCRSFYGSEQASRCWSKKFILFTFENGFDVIISEGMLNEIDKSRLLSRLN